jgi:hypothetical protein
MEKCSRKVGEKVWGCDMKNKLTDTELSYLTKNEKKQLKEIMKDYEINKMILKLHKISKKLTRLKNK